jgi:aminoglycoside phosphotransferase (APT) family kinase protein
MDESMANLLQIYCESAFPNWQNVRTSRFAYLADGWESVIYAFDLDYLAGEEPHHEGLVLRIYPGADPRPKARREYEAIFRLGKAGYPVPRVFLLECDHSPFTQPFILMERIEGRPLWNALSDAQPAEQAILLERYSELYVRLHRLDWRLLARDEGDSAGNGSIPVRPGDIDTWLNMARTVLQGFGWPLDNPFLVWLEQHRANITRSWPAATHGDFHPNNVLLRPDGAMVVIDWTNFDLTDARFDLAWTLVLANSYMGMEWRDRFLQAYERQAGQAVEQIEYFEVCACARRLFDLSISISAGAEKMGMRTDAVEAMKAQVVPARRVYQMLQKYTGLRVEPFEQLLASLG